MVCKLDPVEVGEGEVGGVSIEWFRDDICSVGDLFEPEEPEHWDDQLRFLRASSSPSQLTRAF